MTRASASAWVTPSRKPISATSRLRWVTVNATRSRFFGPDEPSTDAYPSGPEPFTNVQSDFSWKSVLDRDLVGKELPVAGRRLGRRLRCAISFVVMRAGYNHYLAKTGVINIPDARCRGAEWVQPITEQDVYLRALHWSSFLSSVSFVQDYERATPPAVRTKKKTRAAQDRGRRISSRVSRRNRRGLAAT